jgi:hypothetical protein
MQRAAAKRGREFERAADKAPAPGRAAYVDYSRRSFFKEFVKVVQSSDVLIEVLDARDPLGCRCLDVERFVRKIDPSKKIVLLLNKIGGCTCLHCLHCVRMHALCMCVVHACAVDAHACNCSVMACSEVPVLNVAAGAVSAAAAAQQAAVVGALRRSAGWQQPSAPSDAPH